MRRIWVSITPILILFFILLHQLCGQVDTSQGNLRVLSYSVFLNSWGPGPIIAQKFYEKYGLRIEFIDAGEAGLLTQKLKIFKADVVLGLDQIGILQAGTTQKWLSLSKAPEKPPEKSPEKFHAKYSTEFFQAIDWAPMTFVFRKSEMQAPRNLDELLEQKFAKKISIADPRTSTAGLQFLFWLIKIKGFDFLRKIKNSIGFVGSSWSAAYGHFQKKHSAVTFSYLTSPVYHWNEEKNFDYQAVVLEEPVPIQVEFVAIPEGAAHPELAKKFVDFLLQDEIQKILMQKNFMLPMNPALTAGSPFAELPPLKTLAVDALDEFYQDRERILSRWQVLWNEL